MFRVQSTSQNQSHRAAVVGLLILSAASLAVTIWVMIDLLREQEIVQSLIRQLPADARGSAEFLVGELRWQFRLSILVVLNLVVTGFAVALLWRAYQTSQHSLRDLKALATDILNSMNQAVITTDTNDVVTSINARGIELLGLTHDKVGRPLNELAPGLPLVEFKEQARNESPAACMQDFPLHHGGPARTLRAFCHPLKNHDNEEIGNVLQLRDVTERVLMEERMRRMERYMGLGSLAAGLHHEIKNPLAALSLHVQLLEEELDAAESTDDVLSLLSVIKTEVTRIGAVLETFRDFASIEKLNLSDVSFQELIRQQLDLIEPQARQRQISVHQRLDPDVPAVAADKVRMEQVVLNLMLNALDAMPAGGRMAIHLSVTQRNDADYVSVQISDTGPGVPDTIRDRIFDAYFTTKSDGTGMGLALCDKIIRQHGGSLEFTSSETGTVFEFLLPVPSNSVDELPSRSVAT